MLASLEANPSGVAVATTLPPLSPPSGPRSMIQSALAITSKLCSIIITAFPFSTSLFRTSNNFCTSTKCSPVVGSSRIYTVFPVPRLESSAASLIL